MLRTLEGQSQVTGGYLIYHIKVVGGNILVPLGVGNWLDVVIIWQVLGGDMAIIL